MDHDDVQVGTVLSRREALAVLGAAGASVLAGGIPGVGVGPAFGAMRPACVVRPEQTEGPYFLEEKLNRSDIRADLTSGRISEGAPLDLVIRVGRVAGGECLPLPGAVVDVWQCDALGIYSGVKDIAGQFETLGENFLRGHQVTDAEGNARFMTVYPGWYQGRTVHIHFKIRTAPEAGRAFEFTSQLYFDDAFTDRVLGREPYASRGPRSTRNEQDGIFRDGGDQLMMAVTPKGDAYAGTFEVGLQLA